MKIKLIFQIVTSSDGDFSPGEIKQPRNWDVFGIGKFGIGSFCNSLTDVTKLLYKMVLVELDVNILLWKEQFYPSF